MFKLNRVYKNERCISEWSKLELEYLNKQGKKLCTDHLCPKSLKSS